MARMSRMAQMLKKSKIPKIAKISIENEDKNSLHVSVLLEFLDFYVGRGSVKAVTGIHKNVHSRINELKRYI